jgi:hypothetical protein
MFAFSSVSTVWDASGSFFARHKFKHLDNSGELLYDVDNLVGAVEHGYGRRIATLV